MSGALDVLILTDYSHWNRPDTFLDCKVNTQSWELSEDKRRRHKKYDTIRRFPDWCH